MSVLTVWPEVALPGLWISGQYSKPTSKIHVLNKKESRERIFECVCSTASLVDVPDTFHL